MILLEKSKYYLVNNELDKVSQNKLYAYAVVDNMIDGKVYVDDIVNPKAFYIIHPYGMSLLLGESNNQDFNNWFHEYAMGLNGMRKVSEWVQVYPNSWNQQLSRLFEEHLISSRNGNSGAVIKQHTRVNFSFNISKYLNSRENFKKPYCSVKQIELGERGVEGFVVPEEFWPNEGHFHSKGIGFNLFYKGNLASTAFSAFVRGKELEIGIETAPEFQGKGLATYNCSVLIDHCIEHDLLPIWSCRLGNIGSCMLAQKLGFEPTLHLPYYELPLLEKEKLLDVQIIPFKNHHNDLKKLSYEWLNKYTGLEPADELHLDNPEQEIIAKGGHIFMAKVGETIAGTISLVKKSDNSFEIAKLAVTENFQGKGIGKVLMKYGIEIAKKNGANSISLYTSSLLKAALSLYHKLGFEQKRPRYNKYRTADIYMELAL